MSQPVQPPQFQPPQPQPMPPPPIFPPIPQKKQKRFGWVALVITALVSLGVGGAVAGSDGTTTTTAEPAPTVTATVTETADPPVEGGSEPTAEPTVEPTKAPAGWNPKPKEFKVGIKVLSKECFGEAGCNIAYKVSLDYLGTQEVPDEGTTDITYKISGAEQEILGTITLNSEGKFDSYEESTSTTGSSKKLTATVTEVDYNEFG